ncbi:1-acyl-sn-glycerol-3-phosphate acyltransferase [Mycobacterium sp. PSTR-4-N]|uniref:1-acyl-sn-glycerol-3-phosphate acyltransferase n=1 Tax=Mycobacterium sp. PSTR-4-N TaxID=2917745 RepID=UPI001F154588|nr:1-acyl-sn-glycerol-3-phosphate acyltransferase [Mycobacterium sp. PSTR-4-N]MCG7596265.1 1-acyl-sn-glycerol-3-phosphate acyltransferase [Mycobacterium sp. PSTR-4-N]
MVADAERGRLESFADGILSALDGVAESLGGEPVVDDAIARAMAAVAAVGGEFVRRYHRLDIDSSIEAPDQPVLFVANHGFGGVVDLNVFAVRAALDEMHLDRPLTILTHQMAWTLGVGRLFEPLGARPASRDSAVEAFDAGHHVLVFPGGDKDAAKTFDERNLVKFDGRSGFARLAMEQHVPIVPLVTAGAGESLLVLSSGERLARALRLDKILRVKALPVSVSVPWGLNVGAVGMLPYLPLPTKLVTRVLAPMTAGDDETAEQFAARVESAMQDAMTDLTRDRKPLLG